MMILMGELVKLLVNLVNRDRWRNCLDVIEQCGFFVCAVFRAFS